MRTPALTLCALVAGCTPNFDSVADACPGKLPGAKNSEADAIGVFTQMSCYRRFAGLPSARIDTRVSEAARSHAVYIDQNGVEGNPLLEDPGNPAFTGEDPLARVSAQGYDFGTEDFYEAIGFWEGVFLNDPSFDPTAIADGWMWGQYTRQGVLQPAWVDGGYGSTDAYAVLTILYDFPATQAIGRPVAWPRDEQVDVPPAWVYAYDDGIIPLFADVGYPVTFTIGSDEDESDPTSENPYELHVTDSTLDGPDGEVDHVRLTPDVTPFDFPYTVALIAEAPLDPSSTYTATVRMRWNAHKTDEFTTTFSTGEDALDARRTATPLYVVERPPGGPLRVIVP